MNLKVLIAQVLVVVLLQLKGFDMQITRKTRTTQAGLLRADTSTVAPMYSNENRTCYCVPSGTCASLNLTTTVGPGTSTTTPYTTTMTTTTLSPNQFPNDGSGLIDIRQSTGDSPLYLVPANFSRCTAPLLKCCRMGKYMCGVRYPPVVNATPPASGQSTYGSYPWIAVILDDTDAFIGSGALIDGYHILTAAHRVRDFNTYNNNSIDVRNGRTLKIRLGEWDASSINEPVASQEYQIASIFIHPNFNPINLKNDVALLRTTTPVLLGFSPYINTACFSEMSFTGTRCFVAGWGKNDFLNGTYQTIQKEVDLPIRSGDECQNLLRATRLGPTFEFDLQSFICAGGELGKDACTGDGGSPLMCNYNNRWWVAGLVAWGIGCNTGNVPGVYVNVAAYYSWIMSTVATNPVSAVY